MRNGNFSPNSNFTRAKGQEKRVTYHFPEELVTRIPFLKKVENFC